MDPALYSVRLIRQRKALIYLSFSTFIVYPFNILICFLNFFLKIPVTLIINSPMFYYMLPWSVWYLCLSQNVYVNFPNTQIFYKISIGERKQHHYKKYLWGKTVAVLKLLNSYPSDYMIMTHLYWIFLVKNTHLGILTIFYGWLWINIS